MTSATTSTPRSQHWPRESRGTYRAVMETGGGKVFYRQGMVVQRRRNKLILCFAIFGTKLVKIKKRKRFRFSQPQRHLSVDNPHTSQLLLAPVSLEELSVSWAAVLVQGAEPLLPSEPVPVSLPEAVPLPRPPVSQSSLTPFPLYSLHSRYHLIFWHCFDIYGLSLLFQPFG